MNPDAATTVTWLPAQWPAPPGIVAGTTLRSAGDLGRGGQVGPEHPARAQLAAQLGVTQLVFLHQVHGTAVLSLPSAETLPEADAVVSAAANSACCVLTADCLPVLLCDTRGAVVGAAHAGWRGLLDGVLEATVSALRLHTDQPLLAWLGPAIGPAAFEVGPEVRAAFVARDSQSATAFVPGRGDRWMADLYSLARQRLCNAGLSAQHLYGGGECTVSDAGRWHSWRRDGSSSGRMASVILRRSLCGPAGQLINKAALANPQIRFQRGA